MLRKNAPHRKTQRRQSAQERLEKQLRRARNKQRKDRIERELNILTGRLNPSLT